MPSQKDKRPDPDWDDMTPSEVRKWGEDLAYRASQFGEMRATLIVNCQPGRRLADLGIQYDDSKVSLTNLVHILDSLCNQIDEYKRKLIDVDS